MIKRLNVLAIALLLVMSLTSCTLFDINDRYVGGELLDDEMMSEIIDERFSDETDTLEEESNGADTGEAESSSKIEDSGNNEPNDNADGEDVVYWTESGKVWHTHRDCGRLKQSTEILSGSVDDAIEEGKTKLCSYCENKDKD